MRKLLKAALRLVGPGLLLVLLLQVDTAQATAVAAKADPVWVLAGGLALALLIGLKAWRWKRMLDRLELPYPLGPLVRTYAISSFLGFVTPGRVGDVVRVFYLARWRRGTVSSGLATILVDRVADLGFVALMALVALPVVAPVPAGSGWVAAGAALLVAVGVLMLLRRWPRGRLAAIATRLPVIGRMAASRPDSLDRFEMDTRRLLSWPTLIPLALITVPANLLMIAASMALAEAFALPVPLETLVAVTGWGTLVSLLPLSIAGVGTRDALVVVLFAQHGVDASAALAFSLCYFLISLVFSNGPGALLWMREPLGLAEVRATVSRKPPETGEAAEPGAQAP